MTNTLDYKTLKTRIAGLEIYLSELSEDVKELLDDRYTRGRYVPPRRTTRVPTSPRDNDWSMRNRMERTEVTIYIYPTSSG